MKKLLSALLLTIPFLSIANSTNGVLYNATITRVIDGDTVVIAANWLPEPLKKELSIRVYGVDTPEKGFRAKCELENQRGLAATEFTKEAVQKSLKHQVVLMDWDKYGGRVLGDIILDGQSLKSLLINNGLAREYYGDTKQSWCQ